MTRNKNFADLMPGLFEELQMASKITVLLRNGSDINLFTEIPDTELISVNGFLTPRELGLHLKRLGDGLIDRAMAMQNDLAPWERNEFLYEVVRRFTAVVDVVKPVSPASGCDWMTWADPGDRWAFSGMVIRSEQGIMKSTRLPDIVGASTGKFAAAWHRSTTETMEFLRMLSVMVSFFVEKSDMVNKKERGAKVMTMGNIPQIAAFSRVLVDCNAFQITSRSEFCRLMCRFFCTRNTDNMSFDYFKNCFDKPVTDAIIYVKEECNSWARMAAKLEKRYC